MSKTFWLDRDKKGFEALVKSLSNHHEYRGNDYSIMQSHAQEEVK